MGIATSVRVGEHEGLIVGGVAVADRLAFAVSRLRLGFLLCFDPGRGIASAPAMARGVVALTQASALFLSGYSLCWQAVRRAHGIRTVADDTTHVTACDARVLTCMPELAVGAGLHVAEDTGEGIYLCEVVGS